jgi:hypothetical protein
MRVGGENGQHANEQALQEVRDTIAERGWKDSAEFIIAEIEFVADLCDGRHLSLPEIHCFSREMRFTIRMLLELRDAPYRDELCRLSAAAQGFNRAQASYYNNPGRNGSERWSLADARAWRDHLDQARQVSEASCDSFRGHLCIAS